MKRNENSYKKSGVNISLANKLVDYISHLSKKNVKKRKIRNYDEIGGFGSLFDISNLKIKDPVIVSCTDGVGTKIDLANKFKKFDTIGIDLVAMSVNDLIVQGKLKGNRHGTGIYLSAARSWLFNLLLDRYLTLGKTNFTDTGALWGRGRSSTEADFSEHEQQLLSDWTDWCHALEHAGLKQQRRAFILQPQNLSYKAHSESQFEFNFELPSGSYATAVLREIAELFRPEIIRL